MGFLKDESLYSSAEFLALDEKTQAHLKKPTVPSWEFGTGLPVLGPPRPGPPKQYLNNIAILMNPQSRGFVRLRSTDPREPALFDPKLVSHPYDQRVLITAARSIIAFLRTPSIASTIEALNNIPLNERGEPSDDEEDIVSFLKKNVRSTWHMSGTCKMGNDADEMAVVDAKFRVRGVEGLRVVDLSVLPFLLNAHPVAAAYAVGNIAADKFREKREDAELRV
jgi:choline dehydrogenase-like flavoprotein